MKNSKKILSLGLSTISMLSTSGFAIAFHSPISAAYDQASSTTSYALRYKRAFVDSGVNFPAGYYDEQGVRYELNDGKAIVAAEQKVPSEIANTEGAFWDVVIPAKVSVIVNGESIEYPVRKIVKGAFSGYRDDHLINIYIEAVLTDIEDFAFDSENLKKLTFNDGATVKNMGSSVFIGGKDSEVVVKGEYDLPPNSWDGRQHLEVIYKDGHKTLMTRIKFINYWDKPKVAINPAEYEFGEEWQGLEWHEITSRGNRKDTPFDLNTMITKDITLCAQNKTIQVIKI